MKNSLYANKEDNSWVQKGLIQSFFEITELGKRSKFRLNCLLQIAREKKNLKTLQMVE